MLNPLYLFFASKAGGAALVLRVTVAVFLLHDAWQMTAGAFQIAGPDGVRLAWDWLLPGGGTGQLIVFWVAGLGLLIGFFTRLISVFLLVALAVAGVAVLRVEPDALREVFLAASLCLSLTIAGGGAFSLDRKISDYLLPTFG